MNIVKLILHNAFYTNRTKTLMKMCLHYLLLMKCKANNTVPKCNRKSAELQTNTIALAHIYMTAYFPGWVQIPQ